MNCERLWKYGYDERLTPLGRPEVGEAAMMGTYGHKLLELYYESLAKGESQSAALESAVAFDPDREKCGCGHTAEYHQQVDGGLLGTKCLGCTNGQPCFNFVPVPFDLEKPKRSAVAQRFREYVYTYSHTDIVPKAPEYLEVGFSEKLYEDDERLYVLEGRIDFIGSYCGAEAVVDHKFQLRERDLYKKSIQFRNYALVTHTSLLLINYIRLAKGITNKTFQRVPATFIAQEHRWWRDELLKIFRRMELARSEGTRQNWSACSGKFGYECDFTNLCEPMEQDETFIEAKKQALYTIKPVWKPW